MSLLPTTPTRVFRRSHENLPKLFLAMSAFPPLQEAIWGRLDLVLGPSRFIRDIFFEHGFVDSCQRGLLPLGIPSNSQHVTGMSHCRQQKVAHGNAKLKALFLGRIDLFKVAEWLLQAFTAAPVPGIELHFAGTGRRAARLHERYRGPHVVFHGDVQDAQKDARANPSAK
jgi:glycosyltransferase involved in cell wall biosynthesis